MAYNSQTDSIQVSKCYLCLFSLIPISLIVACFGVVVFLAGITSLIAFGVDRDRVILACVGSFVVTFSLIFWVVLKSKATEMNPKAANSDIRTEVPPLCHDNPQPTEERPSPPRYEDVVPTGSARQALYLTEQTFMLENEMGRCECESEILGKFQFPPSYEEATFVESDDTDLAGTA